MRTPHPTTKRAIDADVLKQVHSLGDEMMRQLRTEVLETEQVLPKPLQEGLGLLRKLNARNDCPAFDYYWLLGGAYAQRFGTPIVDGWERFVFVMFGRVWHNPSDFAILAHEFIPAVCRWWVEFVERSFLTHRFLRAFPIDALRTFTFHSARGGFDIIEELFTADEMEKSLSTLDPDTFDFFVSSRLESARTAVFLLQIEQAGLSHVHPDNFAVRAEEQSPLAQSRTPIAEKLASENAELKESVEGFRVRRGALLPRDAIVELDQRILEEAMELHERGNIWNEVCSTLSENSVERFGSFMTPGAIRGKLDRAKRRKSARRQRR